MRNIGICLAAVGLATAVCSCTTTTGTRVTLTQANLSGIRTCGLWVKQSDEFSVHWDSDRGTGWGALIGSFAGAGIETGVRGSRDAQRGRDLRPALGGFTAGKLLQEKLREGLEAAKLFDTVVVVDSISPVALRKLNCDAVLEVTIGQWGLVLCSSTSTNDRLQAVVAVDEKLVRVTDGHAIWKQVKLHLNGNCYSMEEYKSRSHLLARELTEAVNVVAGQAVNEIRYAQKSPAGGPR